MHKRSSPIAEDDGRAVGRQRLLGSEGVVVEVKGRGTAQCSWQRSAVQCRQQRGRWLASWLVDDGSDECK
jgi:hypothetical protein